MEQPQPQHAHNEQPWEHPEIRLASAGQYLIGYVMTVALFGIGTFLVVQHVLTPVELFFSLCMIAMIAVVTQLTLLFHLDFSETQLWNTMTLVLNVPLLILSIGLTAWMFQGLYDRLMGMPMAAPHSLSAPQSMPPQMMKQMGSDTP